MSTKLYRPKFGRVEWHDLEVYWFKLLHFINSVEYKDLDILKQRSILNEFGYIRITIDVIGQIINPNGKGEKRIVAWRSNHVIEDLKRRLRVLKLDTIADTPEIRELEKEIERVSIDNHIIYHFSCTRVAADVLGISRNHISTVCNKERETHGGYNFRFEQDWEKDQDLDQKEFFNKIQIGTNGR